MPRGKYIVIEGLDGTGKSTQVSLLREALTDQGIESIDLHEPGGTPIAQEIRSVLKNGTLERDSLTNLLLFTAARHESWQYAKSQLEKGVWVIAERNFYSTLAYQGNAEGLDKDVIMRITEEFTDSHYIHPDVSIILSIDDERERATRIGKRGELEKPDAFESKDSAYQALVRQGYLDVAAYYNLPVIQADQPISAIADAIRRYVL